MKRPTLILLLAAAGAAFAIGCEEKQTEESKKAAADKAHTTTVTPEAREAFATRCASCHGTEGKGNGPASATLNPKPRNYSDKAWQKTVTDEQIKKTIVMGGAAVGKSPIMPASPDLEMNPQMLDGLVALVRQFGT
jgi:cytochrome c553